jgi:hypothetical protein
MPEKTVPTPRTDALLLRTYNRTEIKVSTPLPGEQTATENQHSAHHAPTLAAQFSRRPARNPTHGRRHFPF